MKNKIISIGYLGIKRCYLNIEEEEAIERYCDSEEITCQIFEDDDNISIDTIEIEDEFGAYSVWN